MEHNISQKYWIQLTQEGSSKKRVEYCVDHKNSLAYFRAVQGHSGGIPIMPELMECTSIPYNWTEYIFHRGCLWSVHSILESGQIPGGKETDRARRGVVFSLLNPFGEHQDEEEPMMITQFLRECIIITGRLLSTLSKAQDLG